VLGHLCVTGVTVCDFQGGACGILVQRKLTWSVSNNTVNG
jgi:hypothetical protein